MKINYFMLLLFISVSTFAQIPFTSGRNEAF